MIKNIHDYSNKNVCNISYLSDTVGGKKHLIRGIMDVFLSQVAEELQATATAIARTDYLSIKKLTHAMKSSASIMGISVIKPVLEEMESLGAQATNIDRIKALNQVLNLICMQAILEIEREKLNYV